MNKIRELVDDSGIIFVAYVGSMSQTLLSGMIDELKHEKEMKDIPSIKSHDIVTILIEMTQNIMKYTEENDVEKITSNGLILVGKYDEDNFFIHSQNKVATKDAKIIANRIDEIKKLEKDEIKQKYKELRRNASNSHYQGAGIGFYEIAKRAESINYVFDEIDADTYYFYLTVNIK